MNKRTQKSNAKSSTFFGGAAILAGAVAITKLIGAVYKIPLGNLLGKEGMGPFQAAYNVYSVLLTVSTAGLPLALSRLVAEADALGRVNQRRRIFRVALGLFFMLGLIGGGLMLLLPDALAALLHNDLAAQAIRALAPSLFCVCLLSAIRGYTQGQGRMLPTAVSQIIESSSKLIVGLSLAWVLTQRMQAPPEAAAAGAILGVSAGSLLSLLTLTVWTLRSGRSDTGTDVPDGRRFILRRLLEIGIPVTLGSAGMSLVTLLDQSVSMGVLQRSLGLSVEVANGLYGEYSFALTLFALPPSFIYPLSVSLMPAVSAALTRGDRTAAGKAAGAAMKLTVLTALPAGVGLSVLAEPILLLLYPAVPDTARAAAYHLTFLGLACVFVCLMVAANGVLQAYGHPLVPVLALLCGGVLKVVTNYLMVGDPATGIRGAAVSTLYCYALIVLIDLIAIARLVPERPGYIRLFVRPVLVTAVMALAARSGYGLFCRVLPERWAVLPAIAVAAAVYVILALAVGAVTRTDVVTLPKGEKIADFLHLR